MSIESVFKAKPELKRKLHHSEGLLKTPVILASKKSGVPQFPEEVVEMLPPGRSNKDVLNDGVSFYPRGDTEKASSASLMTLYIPSARTQKGDKLIVDAVAKGLQKAFNDAEARLPKNLTETKKSRATARWLLEP